MSDSRDVCYLRRVQRVVGALKVCIRSGATRGGGLAFRHNAVQRQSEEQHDQREGYRELHHGSIIQESRRATNRRRWPASDKSIPAASHDDARLGGANRIHRFPGIAAFVLHDKYDIRR
jgi:hypothetical protein